PLSKVHPRGHLFSRSYEVSLPNSLTRVLPFALVYSTHLPVSVCGTGARGSTLRGFSWQPGSVTLASGARHRASAPWADLPAHLDTYTLSTGETLAGPAPG